MQILPSQIRTGDWLTITQEFSNGTRKTHSGKVLRTDDEYVKLNSEAGTLIDLHPSVAMPNVYIYRNNES